MAERKIQVAKIGASLDLTDKVSYRVTVHEAGKRVWFEVRIPTGTLELLKEPEIEKHIKERLAGGPLPEANTVIDLN